MTEENNEKNSATLPEIETSVEVEAAADDVLGQEPVPYETYVMPGVTEKAFNDLTNKNRQFMVNVDKGLADNLSDDIKQSIYAEMVETLLGGQLSSQTARQIYGTPTETVEVIQQQKYEEALERNKVVSPDWQIAMDGGLLWGSLFTALIGITLFNANDTESFSYMGVFTLIINYIAAGVALLITSKHMPNFEAPKGERGIWKYFLISTLSMLGWFGVVTISAMIIPSQINIVFSGTTYIVIAAATIALRFLLKRVLNIQGGMFSS